MHLKEPAGKIKRIYLKDVGIRGRMSDIKDRFDKWQREAKETFEDIDKKLGLSEKIEEGSKVILETAQKGAERIKAETEKTEVGKQAVKAAESTIKTAGEAAQKAWKASGPIREAAEDVGEKVGDVAKEVGRSASDVVTSAGNNAERAVDEVFETVGKGIGMASRVVSFGSTWGQTFESARKTFNNTVDWVEKNPLQAAASGASIVVGAGLGAVLTGISSHWLLNSALPVWSLNKIGEQFNGYLKSREDLIDKGELDEAEIERVRFERDIARKIGAPLLGAFSFASGVVLMTNVLNPKTITGFPFAWLIGGNPFLEGIWFFGNGVVCFKTSYDFFMIALEDQSDVQRIIKNVRGLLPESIVS